MLLGPILQQSSIMRVIQAPTIVPALIRMPESVLQPTFVPSDPLLNDVRSREVDWLSRLARSINSEDLNKLVAHRAFHDIHDEIDARPLENTLQAFSLAWFAGIHNCECDIALTKDGKLILSHDETFERLSLDKSSPLSKTKVTDLTYDELSRITLSDGSKIPLLEDVLRTAQGISDQSKLVIEIKPNNQEAAVALAALLQKNPDLIPSVGLIMSFDLDTIYRCRQEMDARHVKNRPLLMLLTVSEPTKSNPDAKIATLFEIEEKVLSGNMILDGVYIQYQQEMKTPEGAAVLKALSDRYFLGVWGYSGVDPDDWDTFRQLVDNDGLSFVNTDLPLTFRLPVSQ